MSVVSTVNQIDFATVQFAPAVLSGIQAAEQSSHSGENKKQAVLDGILAGAKAGENIPIPAVAAISGMIDLFVSIFNALGLFHHMPAAPTAPAGGTK
jgi:hypothetical protein